jgi:4'-phosphopantetheinyl transferase EntD
MGGSGEPIWPRGVVGSISHAAGSAVSAVAHHGDVSGIGIDLEHDRDVADIVHLVAFGAERDWLDSHMASIRDRKLLELFAAKESLFKAVFPKVKRYFDFDAVELEPQADGSIFRSRFLTPLDGLAPQATVTISVVRIDDDVLALAVLP